MSIHPRVLSERYPMNINMTRLRCPCALDESSLSIGRVKKRATFFSVFLYFLFLSLPLVALELQPDDPLVHKRRADVRGKLGLQELAIEDYRRAIEIQSRGRR